MFVPGESAGRAIRAAINLRTAHVSVQGTGINATCATSRILEGPVSAVISAVGVVHKRTTSHAAQRIVVEGSTESTVIIGRAGCGAAKQDVIATLVSCGHSVISRILTMQYRHRRPTSYQRRVASPIDGQIHRLRDRRA